MKLKSINEIDGMLMWLEKEIIEYEISHCKPRQGSGMVSSQCEKKRQHYAGCLAERSLLRK